MSDDTEQDESGQVGDGGETPGAGAPADTVWPVWGGAPSAHADDEQPELTSDAPQGVDDESVPAEPESTSDPSAAETAPEPTAGESEPEAEPHAEPAESAPETVTADAEAETTDSAAETVSEQAATESVSEPEPAREAEGSDSAPASEETAAEPAAPESTPESEIAESASESAASLPGSTESAPEPVAVSESPGDETSPAEDEPAAVGPEVDEATAEPVVATKPEPTSEPEPVVATEAEPTPEPVVATEPEPTPEPEPVVATAPEPTPEPEAAPAAEPARGDETEVIAPVVAAAAATAATAPVRVSATQAVAPVGEPTPPPVPAPSAPTPAPAVADPPPAATAVLPPVAGPAPAVAGGFAPVTAASAAASSTIQAGRVPSSERATSPLDVFEPEDRRRRWPRRLLWILGIVLVLCAAYVGASFATADTVPRGASVAGVDIGGLKSAEAVTRLETELADETTQPIPVIAQDVQATLDPTTAGLTFDAQATVDELTGVDLADPTRLWNHIVGIGEQPPVTTVDPKKLAASIDGLGTALQLLPVDGTIVYVDATAQSTDAVDGWDVDPVGSAKVITSDWLVAPRPLNLPTTTVPPAITQEKTDAALTEATKVTSAPVSVMVDNQVALLDATTLAANAAYVPTNGNLVLQMNGDGLTAAVLAQLPTLLTASADAHFEFVDGAPVIIPGTPGTTLDPAAVATAVAGAAVSNDRTATVELVEADPSQSTAALEQLGIKEIVSEFSTPLTSEPRRTINITNGASKINGTLIKPGETFSLTEALGPIDAAHGFVEAGAIVSGEHTDAWGGGLSQVSTTSYNAGFLAGFEDIEHRPHSEWFARYPEGREATIFTGTLDMRWKNNTPYGALIQAWVADNRVYVRVWGTKYWSVESITSPRSGVVQPTTVYSQSPTCEASSAGNPGFTVTVTRKTSLNGELVKTESNTWRYKPQNKIICGPAPTPTP